jgi:diguanylate cyclase (GGDEF)-like protein/PAS domain S-box-containing protein
VRATVAGAHEIGESEERYSLATRGANDGLWDWDLKKQEIYFSSRWKSMLGYSESQIGHSPDEWFKRLHPADKDHIKKLLAQHVSGGNGHFESEYRILDATGTYRWVLCRGLALRNSAGEAYRVAGWQTDITDRKLYNPLTGLPNRILLADRLERALGRVRRQDTDGFAVVSLHVDGIRLVHDSFGYAAADSLLLLVSKRLQGCIAAQDTVAHCGQADFVLLLEGVKEVADALRVVSRVHQGLEQPFLLDSQTVYVTATSGVTMGTEAYASPEELLRDASAAMYRARSARGRCEVFDQEMRSLAVSHMQLESDFRKAFDRSEFRVHYQPIVSLKTGALEGFEALVRWQRADQLLVPEEFLRVAESTELIILMEQWVLVEACTQVAKWQSEWQGNLSVNVNLCARHFSNPDLPDVLERTLTGAGLAPRQLHLEMTETALMENTRSISETLSRIRGMGIEVHMDDFGTGYSSLSYLHKFPVDTLKIDRSFIGKLGISDETWKIVQAIAGLARSLGMKVIAEGIENLMQLRMLQSLGCEFGQGYYFSKALDSDGAEALVRMVDLPWAVAFDKTTVYPFLLETWLAVG